MKLWAKNKDNNSPSGDGGIIEQFTVGKDREFDLLLAPFDVLGNIAHAKMLAAVGLLTNEEAELLSKELRAIYKNTQSIEDSRFTIHDNVEDVHSQVEFLLTEKLGDTGKKIHSARSRNDQVLVDIKLFLRSELEKTVQSVQSFFALLVTQSEKFK